MKRARSGFVLLTVLIVIMVSTMTAVSVLFAMRAEATAQTAISQGEQAWAAVWSGIHRALGVAESSVRGLPEWEDNPGAFQHQQVADDGANRWYFTIWTASDSEVSPVRFGLSDEASRLNVRTADPAWIRALPGWASPADLADEEPYPSLYDEVGTAADPTRQGSTNTPAGPATSVAAFLAESGVPAAAYLGEDHNYNLRLDPSEDDGDETHPPDDRNGMLDAGLQHYLTVASYEPNTDAQGLPRVNLNDPEAAPTSVGLPAATGRYLEALRESGQTLNHVADLLEAELPLSGQEGEGTVLSSGVGPEELVTLTERCTTTDQDRLPGLINVNTAPAEVLAVLPGIDEALAESIVATRGVLGPEERRSIAWLYTRRLMNAEQFREAAPHLTARGFQFRFHCVGYGLPAGRYRVVEVVVDVAPRPARVVSVRELTAHGFPLPLDLLETETAQVRLNTRSVDSTRWFASYRGGRDR